MAEVKRVIILFELLTMNDATSTTMNGREYLSQSV